MCSRKSRNKSLKEKRGSPQKILPMDIHAQTKCCSRCGNVRKPETWKPLSEFSAPRMVARKDGTYYTAYRTLCKTCDNFRRNLVNRKAGARKRLVRTPEHDINERTCDTCDKTKKWSKFRLMHKRNDNEFVDNLHTSCFKCEEIRRKPSLGFVDGWHNPVIGTQRCELCNKWQKLENFDDSVFPTVTGKQRACRHCKTLEQEG